MRKNCKERKIPTKRSACRTEEFAWAIRAETLRMIGMAKASHLASNLSIAEILAVLYGSVLRIDPKTPRNAERDRFILSKGHACAALYTALAESRENTRLLRIGIEDKFCVRWESRNI